MNYQTCLDQLQAANENLARINAPFRLAFMSQNKHRNITVEIGTIEQIEKGVAKQALLSYASQKEVSAFLTGFNGCLLGFTIYSMQINQTP